MWWVLELAYTFPSVLTVLSLLLVSPEKNSGDSVLSSPERNGFELAVPLPSHIPKHTKVK